MCRSKEPVVKQLQAEAQRFNDFADIYNLSGNKIGKKFFIDVKVNGRPVTFEFDTGAALTCINGRDFKNIFPDLELKPPSIILQQYDKSKLRMWGEADVDIEFKGQLKRGTMHVVPEHLDSVFGVPWLEKFLPDLKWSDLRRAGETHQLQGSQELTCKKDPINQIIDPTSKDDGTTKRPQVQPLLDKFPEVFEKGIGELKGFACRIHLKEGAQPVFFKPRPVPLALREKIGVELERLQQENILEPVTSSEWATPIVPVVKPDGRIRICGDYKVTLNPLIKVDQYTLPRIEELFAIFQGGILFSKIDISEAYLHMPVDERDRDLLTINTHKGLFRYCRMNYGISSAPAIWQRTMETLFAGIEGVGVFIDDIVITGRSDQEHLDRLYLVLQRLSKHGLRVNREKCKFFEKSITYCGHVIDRHGLHKTEEKIRAVRDAPRPKDVTAVKSFLGLVTYYGRFVEQLATLAHPLHQLLKKGVTYKWSTECENAFLAIKHEIASNKVLTHYDPALPLVLATDASPVGLGAVLSHRMPDGTERPLAFASRSLTTTECHYSQIDKEALGIVWGVKHFYQYVFGRVFVLVTDHKPLVSIFAPHQSLPALSATRMLHYAMFLQAFTYTIEYRKTEHHGNADALSRLPLLDSRQDHLWKADIANIGQLSLLPVTAKEIATGTKQDPELRELYQALFDGHKMPAPWTNKEVEFSLQQGCVLRGTRVIIPERHRTAILEELHVGHFGVVKMKALARQFVFWSGIDADIESFVKNCPACLQKRKEPTANRNHHWEWPDGPWQRIHVDHAGPFMGHMFLVVTDAYSKWNEVMVVKDITSETTMDFLRTLFARYGLPQALVSDNGSSFVSKNFTDFLSRNGIRHMTGAPYHAATNGQAERMVQTFKNALKCSRDDSQSLNTKLQNHLLMQRKMPHALTGESPAMLFLGRNIRSRLDLVVPSVRERVQQRQANQHSRHPDRDFQVGDQVAVRDYRQGSSKWQTGTIQECLGDLNYRVQVPGNGWDRHVDQIVQQVPVSKSKPPENDSSTPGPRVVEPVTVVQELPTPVMGSKFHSIDSQFDTEINNRSQVAGIEINRQPRVKKPVDRLNL